MRSVWRMNISQWMGGFGSNALNVTVWAPSLPLPYRVYTFCMFPKFILLFFFRLILVSRCVQSRFIVVVPNFWPITLFRPKMASSDFVQNGPITANVLPASMPPQPGFYPIQPSFRVLNPMPPMPYFRQQLPPSTSSTPTTPSSSSTTISLNRSQRCGICDGCKRKACGLCNYCLGKIIALSILPF